jgi:hypothetical protein
MPVEIWSTERTEAYIKARLTAHGKAQHELPDCTAEERWEHPGIYALYKKGNSRASSLHGTREEAEAALSAVAGEWKNKRAGFEIRERPAEQRRCEDYCSALPFCEQGQRLINATEDFRLAQHWTVSAPRAPAAQ